MTTTSIETAKPMNHAQEVAELNKEVVTVIQGKEVTRGELLAAFNKVCDSSDWKGPILGVIPVADLALTAEAVEFFTATKLQVVRQQAGRCVVEAVGYRAGPAA